jgi:polysaccharide biosynthesis/export protein
LIGRSGKDWYDRELISIGSSTMKRPGFFLMLIAVLLCGISTAAAQAQASAAADIQNQDYIIGIEDVLALNVWKEQELSIKDIVVRPDGKISIPLIGDLKADGMSVKQLQDSIAAKLKEYVTAPVVTVTVTKIMSRTVSIVGQVTKSGVYPLGSSMTVLELLARAGGLKEDAKPKNIKIFRHEDGKTITFFFNYNDMIAGKNLKQNILLKNGDEVVVP